jgi:hypothetical protein
MLNSMTTNLKRNHSKPAYLVQLHKIPVKAYTGTYHKSLFASLR